MAAPSLRVVRRPKGSPPRRALTAAVAPVEDTADIFKTAGLGGRRNNWQSEAWSYLDEDNGVGEFGFYVRFRAGSCSKVRLVASEIDPDTGLPTGSIAEDNAEGRRVAELVRKIAGGPLGQAQLIKRTVEVLSVPGELWIAILQRPEGEKWFAVTREEIEQGNRRNTVKITLPDGTKHEFDENNGDGMFRVWNPHPRRASEPTSPVRANLSALREIVKATELIAAAAESRLANNGILFVPQEASLPPPQAPVSAGKPGDPPAPTQSVPVANQLQTMLFQLASAAPENKRVAIVPVVASGPGDHIKNIQHVKFGHEVSKVNIETRNDAISRLAMGLDMTPEQLLGLGSTSNHWNAFVLKDEDVQLHVSPVMELICQAIYQAALVNALTAMGIKPEKYTLWYDTSRLTADPDLSDEAQEAYEAGAITAEAYVRFKGLPDDSLYDFASPEGRQMWAQDAITKKPDPALITFLMPLLDPALQAIDFPAPPAALPPGQGGGGDGEGDGDPDEEPDTEDDADDDQRQAAAVRGDVELTIVDLLAARALELAGKRRVKSYDRQAHARLRGTPAHEYHRVMGQVSEDEVSELIKGWDAFVNDGQLAGLGLDPERVRASVRRIARQRLTSQVVDGQVV